jgi:hypothetical protein
MIILLHEAVICIGFRGAPVWQGIKVLYVA